MTDYEGARNDALQQAVQHIRDAVRDKSPSARIAGAWTLTKSASGYRLVNRAISSVATNADWHHWSWGHKPITPTNEKDPSRTDWAYRAADEAITDAEEEFRGAYLDHIAATSRVFSTGQS
jgi:hypothetical protein